MLRKIIEMLVIKSTAAVISYIVGGAIGTH